MKKHLLLLTFFLICSFSASAKIWRINNNNGIVANFRTLQEAHDGASAGDTLHVEGSPNNYGGASISKKLIIIGPGYFLNQNTGLQMNSNPATIGAVYFYAGSEGSQLMGMDLAGTSVLIYANDITVKRNKFTGVSGEQPDWFVGEVTVNHQQNNGSLPVNNIVIVQNYGLAVKINYASTGIMLSNNYLTISGYNDEVSSYCISAHTSAVSIVKNNVIRRGRVHVSNSNVSNNILYAGVFEGEGNLTSNNISVGAQFGTENGNKSNVDMISVFEGAGTTDGKWKLKTGSPAKGAGYGNTEATPVDCGMYGGSDPYVLSGIPPIPTIYFFENQPVGSSTDPIDVSIKVRSNN